MVGIPGKSRGCHTCRRRKIRCDEGRPSCQRCIKSGRECEGYEKAPIFLNRTVQGIEKRKHLDEVRTGGDKTQTLLFPQSAPGPSRRQSISPQSPSITQSPGSGGSSTPSGLSQRLSSTEPSAIHLPRRVSDMDLTTEQIRNTLIAEYLPATDSRSSPFAEFLTQTLELDPWGEVLETSLLALTMARLGKTQDNSSMMLQSQLKYGKALRLLQHAIVDDDLSIRDQTIAASNTLKLFEVSVASENAMQSYNSHVNGTVRLILHRGEKRNKTAFGSALINDIRYGAMLVAIQTRQRSIMGDADWRKRTWTGIDDVEQALFDHGFDVAALAEDAEAAGHALLSDWDELRMQALLTRALEIARHLRAWFEIASSFLNWTHGWLDSPLPSGDMQAPWQSPTTGSPVSLRGSPTLTFHDTPSQGKGKTRASSSPSHEPTNTTQLRAAILKTDFWALLLTLSILIQDFRITLSDCSPRADAMALQEASAYATIFQMQLASNILAQLSYQTRPAHGLQASSRAIFALQVAARATASVQHDSDQTSVLREQIDKAMRWLADVRGLGHARIALSESVLGDFGDEDVNDDYEMVG